MQGRRYTCVLILLTGVTFAQAPSRNYQQGWDSFDDAHTLTGVIVHKPGTSVGNLFVEIQNVGGNTGNVNGIKVPVTSNGEFSIGMLGPGSFTLRVLDQSGNVLSQQIVNGNASSRIEVRLENPADSHPASGHVSLFELSHKVPSKAQKEVRTAEKAFKNHDVPGYIEHLQQAVSIDPDYIYARRSLGVIYLRTGQIEKSIEAFQEVVKHDDHSVVAYAGLSVANLALGNYPDSESLARRTLSIDPSNESGQYFLGLSLYLQGKNESEALQLLQKVDHHFPIAHVTEAHILEHMGKTNAVKGALKAYLDSGEESQRSKVTAWLSSLN